MTGFACPVSGGVKSPKMHSKTMFWEYIGTLLCAGFAHMASLVVQWTHLLHEDRDVHHDPSLPANVDETYFLQV